MLLKICFQFNFPNTLKTLFFSADSAATGARKGESALEFTAETLSAVAWFQCSLRIRPPYAAPDAALRASCLRAALKYPACLFGARSSPGICGQMFIPEPCVCVCLLLFCPGSPGFNSHLDTQCWEANAHTEASEESRRRPVRLSGFSLAHRGVTFTSSAASEDAARDKSSLQHVS